MYKRIMIVIDERPAARVAIAEGLRLAGAHGAEVVFFASSLPYPVLAEQSPFVVDTSAFESAAMASTRHLLESACHEAQRAEVFARSTIGQGEDGARSIVEAARRRQVDLIVIASEGRNALMRLLSGSTIPGLITHSEIPVLICKEHRHGSSAWRAMGIARQAPSTPPAARAQASSSAPMPPPG
jgi:nucleotide-binding universal stress UspA family protein